MLHFVVKKPFASLQKRLVDILPETRDRLIKVRKEHGSKVLGPITIDQIIGGMRGIKGLLTETSRLDALKGIKFRGLSLPECQIRLPSVKREPIPEAMLYLLITGEVPSNDETEELKQDLANRALTFPVSAEKIINNLSKDLHPMSQLSIGVLALQTESEFVKAYQKGVARDLWWESALEDSLNLIARIPQVAAMIYRNKYRDGKLGEISKSADLSENFCRMLGYHDEKFWELMRLYLTIHCDHEGGNVSAHACHLVGSALSDPYLSYSAALNGLAGPLHGLANQECLKFMLQMQEEVGNDATEADIEKFVKDTLAKGRVIPGYGHAVLRVTDPRFVCQMEFAQRYMPGDPLCRLIANLYKVAPRVLTETGKVSNPYPNVDAHSGALLTHFGMTEYDFYTVLFGISRTIGCCASYIWSRALALPIERPGSVTIENLEDFVKKS